MLKVFRDNLKYLSWVLWLVIAVFILFVFVDFGGTVPGSTGAPNEAAATVGNQKITYGEFQRAYENYEAFYRQSMGDQFSRELARQMGLPVQVLNGLIADRVLLAEARRMGLQVTDDELRAEILRQFGGNFTGAEEYRRILRANRMTVDEFEASLRRDLLARKMRTVLAGNLFVPEADVERVYRNRVERAKIRFLKLSTADLADQIEVDDSEIEEYFTAHHEDYRIPQKRTVSYLKIDRREIQDGIEVSEEEIRAYYDENQEEFTGEEQVRARHILARVGDQTDREAARQRIEEARRRIEAGEDFAAVAAELSDDPGSKGRGGDLGLFGRGQMVPPFEEAAFGAAAGELTDPVETNFGFHLIEVLEKREAGVQELAEVEDLIRRQLQADRAVTLAESKARELADRILSEDLGPESWPELAATESGVAFQTTEAFARDGYVEGIGSGTDFSAEAFDLAVGETSPPIPIGSGWAVLTVDSISEPRLPELDEVRAEVEADALAAKAIDEVEARLEAALDASGDTDLEELAAELGLETEESGLFGRDGVVGSLGANREIAGAALALDAGQIGGPLRVPDGAVVFEVVERQRFDPVLFEENRESELEALREERLTLLLDSLITERRDEMGVSFDPALIENFGLDGQTSGT